jgi:hypothetical protein
MSHTRCSARGFGGGGLIAFYQIGYGIAAFGVGPLQTWAGLDFNIIYGGTAAFAHQMGIKCSIRSNLILPSDTVCHF